MQFITKLICRRDGRPHNRRINTLSPDAILLETITAQIEMLNVSEEDEKQLQNYVSRTILKTLSFPRMTNRYENILEAHPETYQWIFSDAAEGTLPWSNFRSWLQEDGEIYWISGKAGSGKSTLMKYIFDNPKTLQCLQTWSRTNTEVTPCCVASFFFWNSGTEIQKSQQGLLRALLLQVLMKNPDLAPIVFPSVWAQVYAAPMDHDRALGTTWSLRQLHEGLERLILQKQYPLKICFFVDGLDEYSGNSESLCTLFKNLSTKNKRVKFCLSSRPWVQFQQNFVNCAKLRLHDLTFQDIGAYVNDKFRQSPAFTKLADSDGNLASSLVREITEGAQGVFLWVKVVVQLLLQGVNNRDSIAQLWKRLRSIPKDLYPLYTFMLNQIEPMYVEWASKAFQLMKRTRQLERDPFRGAGLFLKRAKIKGVLPLTSVVLFAALSEDYDLRCIQEMSPEELRKRCEDTRIHLTARCAGLLELSSARDSTEIYQYSPITYMHRTARDFLEQESQWNKILSHTTEFSPDVAMLRASVILIVSRGFAKGPRYPSMISGGWGQTVAENQLFSRTAEDIAVYAYHADDHHPTRSLQTKLLKLFNTWRSSCMLEPPPITTNYDDPYWLKDATLLSLSGYVRDILIDDDEFTRSKVAGVLLFYLFSSVHLERSRLMFPKPKMVRTLLQLSSNHMKYDQNYLPRLKMGACWPWTSGALSQVGKLDSSGIRRLVEACISQLHTFLTAGIDPTDIGEGIPKSYLLCRESLLEDILQHLRLVDGRVDDVSLYHALRSAFEGDVILQMKCNANGSGGMPTNRMKLPAKRIHFLESLEGDESDSQAGSECLQETRIDKSRKRLRTHGSHFGNWEDD